LVLVFEFVDQDLKKFLTSSEKVEPSIVKVNFKQSEIKKCISLTKIELALSIVTGHRPLSLYESPSSRHQTSKSVIKQGSKLKIKTS